MISIAHGFNDLLSGGRVGSDVTALGRPQFYDIPAFQKCWIALRLFEQGLLQAGDVQELPKIVTVAIVGPLLIRKLMPLSQLCDTSFEPAFNAIAGEIVSSVVHAKPSERSRLAQSDSGQDL